MAAKTRTLGAIALRHNKEDRALERTVARRCRELGGISVSAYMRICISSEVCQSGARKGRQVVA